MPRTRTLLPFLLLVMVGGLFVGYVTRPGEWYAALAKPAFNPPNAVFAPVWTLLYILIAFAGARTQERAASSMAMRAWWLQLVLNFLWSPVFFVAHQISLALVVILALLATIFAFVRNRWNADRPAALLFVPYAAWVAFAALLNGSILLLN